MNHFTVLLFRTRAWYLKILWSFFTGKWQLRCGLWYYWSWRQIHQLRNILHEEISKYKHFLSPRADWLFRDSTSGATILTHYQANVFLPTFSQKIFILHAHGRQARECTCTCDFSPPLRNYTFTSTTFSVPKLYKYIYLIFSAVWCHCTNVHASFLGFSPKQLFKQNFPTRPFCSFFLFFSILPNWYILIPC